MDEHGVRALLDRVAADDLPPPLVDIGQARSLGRRTLRHRLICRSAAPVFAVGLMAGLLATGVLDSEPPRTGPVTKPTGTHRPHGVPTSRIPPDSGFYGVAATSPDNGWAVGLRYTGRGWTNTGPKHQPVIVRWDGTAWAPAPRTGRTITGTLWSVAANSASDAWAVGSTQASQPLIEHWNGVAWSSVASSRPSGGGDLYAVAVTSATNAWAVGNTGNISTGQALIEHWTGRRWTVTPSRALAGVRFLYGVAASSPADVWAVGITSYSTLVSAIVHWNGRTWTRVGGPGTGLHGIAAISPGDAWAVGDHGLLVHWNGRFWTAVRSRVLNRLTLTAVAGTSGRDVWAVGWANSQYEPHRSVILHWNGTTWRRAFAPAGRELLSVAAVSSRDAWAVGDNSRGYPLFLHWDGTSWR
jgi:hypothetical protein